MSFHLEQFRVNSIVPRCDYDYEEDQDDQDDLGGKNCDSYHDVVLAKTKVEFGVAGNPSEADEDLDNGLGEAEVGLGGNLGKAENDLDNSLGKAEVGLRGNLGKAENVIDGNPRKAEVVIVVENCNAKKNTKRPQVIDNGNTAKATKPIIDANQSDVSDLTDGSSLSNPWKKKGKPQFEQMKLDFTEIEKNRINKQRQQRVSKDSSVSSNDKKSRTHKEDVELIVEALKKANDILENHDIDYVDINQIIYEESNDKTIGFNPRNLTNSPETVKYWNNRKPSMKPPIMHEDVIGEMLEDSKILVVYDHENKTLIKKVLYGFGLEIKENSMFVI